MSQDIYIFQTWGGEEYEWKYTSFFKDILRPDQMIKGRHYCMWEEENMYCRPTESERKKKGKGKKGKKKKNSCI